MSQEVKGHLNPKGLVNSSSNSYYLSDLRDASQALPQSSKDLLEKFDTHLENIRKSLAITKKSLSDIPSFSSHEKYSQGKFSNKASHVFQLGTNGNVKVANDEVLKLVPDCRKMYQMSPKANNNHKEPAFRSTKHTTSYFDVNYNASSFDADQESQPDTIPTLQGEVDLSQMNQADVDGTRDPGSSEETDKKDTDVLQETGNLDFLQATTDMENPASVYILEDPDNVESGSLHHIEESSGKMEKPLIKRVSFDEFPEEISASEKPQHMHKKLSLDDSILDVAASRRNLDVVELTSIRRTQSINVSIRSISAESIFEELVKSSDVADAEIEQAISLHETNDVPQSREGISVMYDTEESIPVSNETVQSQLMYQETYQTYAINADLKASEDDMKFEEQKQSQIMEESELRQSVKRGRSDVSVKSQGHDSQDTLKSPSQTKSITQLLKSIDTIIHKNSEGVIWKKIAYSDKEILMPVPPNSGIDDDVQSIITVSDKDFIEEFFKVPEDSSSKVKIGVGSRSMAEKKKDYIKKVKIPGINWTRQLQMERLVSQPHLLYKEQWKKNKMMKRNLGPGSYEIKDFIQLANEKPRSGRGICDNLGPRFDKSFQSFTPGPGTYGVGGVPQRALEDKAKKSFSTKGILDAGSRRTSLPTVGSYLAPGTYKYKSFLEELLTKAASFKGPIEHFSGSRLKPLSSGYLASKYLADEYTVKTFIDELSNPRCHVRGRFAKAAQYPEVPTDRMLLYSQSHNPNIKSTPGPGAYTIREVSKVKNANPPGFMSSSKRDDKMAQKFFMKNTNFIGPGRYQVEKFEELQQVNGHTNVFKSKTEKPSLQRAKFLQSRLHNKRPSEQFSSLKPQNRNRSVIAM